MKKSVWIAFSVVTALAGTAAAQEPSGVIAYDSCWYSPEATYCDVALLAMDIGSHRGGVSDGVEPSSSPDGSRIAFAGYSQPGIFVLNLGDWSVAQVSSFGASPAWSPDGTRLAFSNGGLYVMGADGSGMMQLTGSAGFMGQPAWSPDGGTLAFDCEIDSGNRDVCSIGSDGTRFLRLTWDPAWDSDAAFSPDGLAIAFATTRFGDFPEIVVMNPDGTGISRTGAGTYGYQPAWSPDGTRIAFAVPSGGYACPADGSFCPPPIDSMWVMNVDGTGAQVIASGNHPTWVASVRPVASFSWQRCSDLACTFDGSSSWGGDGGIVSYAWNFGDGTTAHGATATHAYTAIGAYTVTLTVVDNAGVSGTRSQVVDVDATILPTASYTYACVGRQCTFDGSGSFDRDGSIASYFWSFGDGETAGGSPGPTISHTYTAYGTFTVRLSVTDNSGARSTQLQAVQIVNTSPVASFTATCIWLTCTLNASASSDPDGEITSYGWNFGDGTAGAGVTVSRTYAALGTYSVTLLVSDDGGATSTTMQPVTALPQPMHVGDLRGTSTPQQNLWTATVTITVHDSSHAMLASVAVSGSWDDGTSSTCTTNVDGRCTVSRPGIPKRTTSVSFSVTNVTRATFAYEPVNNHDADGGSDGSGILVSRR